MPEERDLRNYIEDILKKLGWKVVEWGPGSKGERESLEEVILKNRFFKAIEKINNVQLTKEEKEQILNVLLSLPNSIEGIKRFLEYAKNGIPIIIKRNGKEIPKQIFLFDFENIENNDFLCVREFEVEENEKRRRLDFCLFVNGIPIVNIEAKNPFSPKEGNWEDAYRQIAEDYEITIPSLYKFIQFCIVTDGINTKYFPNYYAKDYSNSLLIWKSVYPFSKKDIEDEIQKMKIFESLIITLYGMLNRRNLIDLIENFIFIKKEKDTYIKIIARYVQFEAANLIFKRVTEERDKKLGLIWHWQGSGKTLTMVFSAWKLLRSKKLDNPSIFIIVDRKELQDQIADEAFKPLEIEIEKIKTTKKLIEVLKWGGKEREGKRGIFICLIQKFNQSRLMKLHGEGMINLERENIIIFTDESHRSQYGILATVMRGIFKNAFIFGFTGTPLTLPERNTFQKFSPKGELYLHRYSMTDSINDGFTLEIKYDTRLPDLHLKKEEIDELAQYEEGVIKNLSPEEKRLLKKKIKIKKAILKSPEIIDKVCKDIAEYFTLRVEKLPLKAMIATVDRECCVLVKRALDKYLPPEYSEIVMSYPAGDKSEHIKSYKEELSKRFNTSDFNQINKQIIDKFKYESLPKILIVSDMLLTGFDSPNLWVLFLYKPLKEHRLLQAISRTNRPLKGLKEYGLVVDYIGVTKYLYDALRQFEGDFSNEALIFIKDIKTSEKEFEDLVNEIKEMLKDLKLENVEDFNKAIEYLIFNNLEEKFTEKVKRLKTLYELLSPSEATYKHLEFYKQVINLSILLSKFRKSGLRIDEIEKIAKKTYELIQKSVGVERIEKIGEIDITGELTELEKDERPIHAIRLLGFIEKSIANLKSDFHINLKEEIERIYEEMKEKKKVTKEIINKIKNIKEKIEAREKEKKMFGEIFPVYEVLKNFFGDNEKTRNASKEIIERLKSEDLLNKESFLKKNSIKKIKGIIRDELIKNFGGFEKRDEVMEKIFTNLEEEYGK